VMRDDSGRVVASLVVGNPQTGIWRITSRLSVTEPSVSPEVHGKLDGLAWRSPCGLSVDGGSSEAYCMRNFHLPLVSQTC